MNNGVKFVLALFVATLLMLAIRAFAFTVYSVPADNIVKDYRQGDRVIVNRLARTAFNKGDHIVFTDSVDNFVGTIVALPGDTIAYNRECYVIPMSCCERCPCPDCKYYLVESSGEQHLIHKHLFVGKAYKLFHLGF